jgi:hypothetical protein
MGGKAREVGEPITRVFDDSDGSGGLDKPGYVLQISTSAECTKSASGAAAYGVAYMDTLDPHYDGRIFTTEYLVDPEIAVVREGTVNVQLVGNAYRSTAIHVGDLIAVSPATAGTVAHWEDNVAQGTANGSFTLANWMAARSEIVGIAEEACAADADTDDDTLLVRLQFFGDES